ncbi:MAG: PIG-L family deacetylase [Acidobacteriota bacterium]|nr:PIG-L family deacetylase [Acidobacteriota bacterium]
MKVLVIGAHPDDEVLGCGGTIARLADEGADVSIHILAEGVTARFDRRDDADPKAIGVLHAQARAAGEILGAKRVELHGLPDNRLDTVALLDVVKVVEEIIASSRPEVIYTHHGGDLNVDHGIVHRAVLTATRPDDSQSAREVYAWEVPSSTEWSFHRFEPSFRPNVFVDVSETLERKIEAMKAYTGELRDFPHPRSPEALESIARRWGTVAGFRAAEAFELVRSLRPRGRMA